MGNLELLSLEDQREINGGIILMPLSWYTEVAIEIGRAAEAFIDGFKAGSREI